MEYNIKTVYVDMDGVLTNFAKRWQELFGVPSDNKKKRLECWREFVHTEQFTSLEVFPGAFDLMSYLMDNDRIDIEILSSSGGEQMHDLVVPQKCKWLKDHKIDIPVNIVPGKSKKKLFATPNSLLIDDTESVILDFVEHQGYAILHRDAALTIASLKSFGI